MRVGWRTRLAGWAAGTACPPWQQWCRAGAIGSSVGLACCTGYFLWRARGWPLVNDAALMHYVVLLMHAGLAPYRDINDYNLPGAYATAWLPAAAGAWLHLSAAAAERWTDTLLLVAAGGAMFAIARRFSWFAGVFAGCLFALYHGRDGIGQAGQRDLWVTVLLLAAMAFLLGALRTAALAARLGRVFGFGLAIGAAVTIKPTACLFLGCVLPMLLGRGRGFPQGREQGFAQGHRQGLSGRALSGLAIGAGFALPLLAMWLFLLHWGATEAFWQVLRVDLPYHASLGRGSLGQLLRASSIASVQKLALLALLAAALGAGWRNTVATLGSNTAAAGTPVVEPGWHSAPERGLLLVCVVLGLLSFMGQGKGYPYQRYPYVAFLLLFAGLEFASALRSPRRALRLVGAAGMAFGVLLCAPSYARAAAAARWSTPSTDAVEQALLRQARAAGRRGLLRSPGQLQGQVQCLDVISGCTDALLHLRLREATGTMYDEMLFPQAAVGWRTQTVAQARASGIAAAVLAQQQRFQQTLPRAHPQVIIVTSWLFPEGPGDYSKLALWPWLNAYLAQHYRLVEEHTFARAENGPMGFRVYQRLADAALPPIH